MKDWKWILSLGSLVLGILIALQFKEQRQEGFPLATYRPVELIRLVRDAERDRALLQEELQSMRTRLAAYEASRGGKGNFSRVLAKDLLRTRLEAGLVPVKGPGVEVVLYDSPRRPHPGEDDYFYLVHDVDLSQLVNELWALGAEAVSVNNQRMVASSSIRCVGPTVLVNTMRLSPPYRVYAIGDPDTLAAGLQMRGGFLDAMTISRSHGVTVAINKQNELLVPAFNGVMTFRYSTPALK